MSSEISVTSGKTRGGNLTIGEYKSIFKAKTAKKTSIFNALISCMYEEGKMKHIT